MSRWRRSVGGHSGRARTLRFSAWWRLLEPIIGAKIRRGEIAELVRLKKVVEASSP